MIQCLLSAVLLSFVVADDAEEPFKLPTLKGNAYLADPFANKDVLGSVWKPSSSQKGDGSKFDGMWGIETATGGNEDLGLVVKDKAKHHAISAKLNSPVDFTDLHANQKPLIVQYEVKYQENMECGGSYLKLIAEGDAEFTHDSFNDKSVYSIMFGPDKCGLDSKIHFIINYKNPISGSIEEKHAKSSENFKEMFTDGKSHLITLILESDGTFEILVDQNTVNSGSIHADMTPSINPAAEIDDPEDKKPTDWDDKEKIPDPLATKPEDWNEDAPKFITDPDAVKPDDWLDDEPEFVADPASSKPEDWDDEEDGEWEAPQIANPKCEEGNCGVWTPPQIPNPEYKGKWAPPLIDNPNYSGIWAPKKIANPDFFEDKTPFASLMPIVAVGIEMWTMTKNIMFDNIIITDSRTTADEWAADSWNKKALREKLASSGDSMIDQAVSLATENPIMWVVYAGVVLLPVILIYFLCCRGGSTDAGGSDEVAEAKKTDKVTPDDEQEEDDMPGLEGEEEEEKEVAEEKVEEKEEEEDVPAKRRTRKAD